MYLCKKVSGWNVVYSLADLTNVMANRRLCACIIQYAAGLRFCLTNCEFSRYNCVIEWSFVHSNNTGKRFFYCIEHKTRRLSCCQDYWLYSSNSYSCINVTVHIKSAFTVYIYIYSSRVTSNENIHTYSSVCIVEVHSDVHLSSSVPIFSLLFFPSQYIVV